MGSYRSKVNNFIINNSLYLQQDCICKYYMIKATKNLDIWGTTTSMLCAVHCALFPILLSIGLIGSNSWLMHPFFEVSILGLTAIFIYFSIVKEYIRTKSDVRPVFLAFLGAFFILLHHFISMNSAILVVSGGLLIALAHLVNLRIKVH